MNDGNFFVILHENGRGFTRRLSPERRFGCATGKNRHHDRGTINRNRLMIAGPRTTFATYSRRRLWPTQASGCKAVCSKGSSTVSI